MVRCKRERLILNTVADEAVDADNEQDTAANKELNAAADEAVNIDKERDATASRQPNAAAKPSMLIKDQMTRRTKLGGWIEVG